MNMIKRAVVSLPGDDSGNVANTQVTYLGRTAQVEVIYPYGTAGKAPKDSQAIMFNIQGQEENRVIIEYRTTGRFKNLKDGEYIVGNEVTGAFVKFLENGDIEIDAGAANVNLTAANLNITGDVAVVGNTAFTGTVTANGKTIDDTHGHTQGKDSNGDSEAAISGVT
jgi:phage baseplate assembly protein gpV